MSKMLSYFVIIITHIKPTKMAESKKDKTRSKKAENFKKEAQKAAVQAGVPRTHMLPQTEWRSTDNLELRGDLAEGFEIQLVRAFEALQAAGQIFQQLMALNIQSGIVKINYIWNDGSIPTEKELADYKAAMDFAQKQREQFQQAAAGQADQANTLLETIGGQPLTVENLEAEKPSLIIQP
jgi:hypothetical protein